jgi:parvulin-like peptidyl-prolyl isomerase
MRIATVAGRPIYAAQLEERLAYVRLQPRGRHIPPEGAGATLEVIRWLTRQLVTEAILRHEMPADMEEPEAAVALFDRVTADVTVPETEVRAYYERNPDLYRRPESRRVRHVLVTAESAARQVVARVAAGEDMASVAWDVSRDRGSRAHGGDMGELRRGELAGPLEDAVFAARVGRLIGPVRTDFGWHVARVEGIQPAHTLPYAEVSGQIRAELLAAAREAAFDAWLESRRRALAIIEPAYEHPGHPVHGLPRHRH